MYQSVIRRHREREEERIIRLEKEMKDKSNEHTLLTILKREEKKEQTRKQSIHVHIILEN